MAPSPPGVRLRPATLVDARRLTELARVAYAHYVDLEPFTLQAMTHDVEQDLTFDERQDILDAMVETLTFVEVEPDEDADETDNGEDA
jgi:hypothetical protein